MKKEEYIKESIKIEMDFFKVFVSVIIVLGAGNYVLLTQLAAGKIYLLLFVYGLIFFVFFVILAFKSYFTIKNYHSDLKKFIKND